MVGARRRVTLARVRAQALRLQHERSREFEQDARRELESVTGRWAILANARPSYEPALAVARILHATRAALDLDQATLSEWATLASAFLRQHSGELLAPVSDCGASRVVELRLTPEHELAMLAEEALSEWMASNSAHAVAERILVSLSAPVSAIRDALAIRGVDVLAIEVERVVTQQVEAHLRGARDLTITDAGNLVLHVLSAIGYRVSRGS